MGGSFTPNDIRIEGLTTTAIPPAGSSVPLTSVHHSSTLPNNPAFVTSDNLYQKPPGTSSSTIPVPQSAAV